MTGEIDRLIDALSGTDRAAARRAGEALVALGEPALAPLLATLEGPSAEARKSASFLLGRYGREVGSRLVEPLVRALGDAEPKVRKNAAVSLGRLAPASALEGRAVTGLVSALERESVAWVRSSMILALGALGGDRAVATLAGLEATSEAEAEALGKARDRLMPRSRDVRWRDDAALDAGFWVAVPVGLEGVARSEAEDAGFEVTAFEWGRLRLGSAGPAGVDHPQSILDRLRCCRDVRVLLGEGPSLESASDAEIPGRIADLFAGSTLLTAWRRRIETPDSGLGYRFSLPDFKVSRQAFHETLRRLRSRLEGHGLRDRPSAYSVGLEVEVGARATRIWMVLSFLRDERFAYRLADVGASLDPVVAAGLARWNRVSGARSVFDPTCGSATLLIERARLDPELSLVGVDVSLTAVTAARTNVEAAGLGDRISVFRRDAADRRAWRPVTEVLANLPFGVRSRQQDEDLDLLYRRIVGHLDAVLDPAGRAVLYTANRRAIAMAMRRAGGGLRIDDELEIGAGGLRVVAHGLSKR